MAGGEEISGGANGVVVARRLGRCSGEVDARTGCPLERRCRWWRRRGQGVDDGGGRGGGVLRRPTANFFDSGEERAREEE